MRLKPLIALAVLCVLGLPAFGQGLVRNADFSQQDASGKLPADWTVDAAAQALYSNPDDDGHSGSFSLRYDAWKPAPAGLVTQMVAVEPNTDYVLTAALKSDGKAKPFVEALVEGTTNRAAGVVSDGATTWKVFSARFNSGEARSLVVRIFGDREMASTGTSVTGKSGIDDVQIYLAAEAPADMRPADLFEPPGPNVALGKSYTLSPAPNYGYSTDPDDRVQLTDGIYTVGYFWTQKTTVGWSNAVPAIITIDLGEVLPIAGLSYSTAAGVAGVTWPASIGVLVSDDQASWRQVGDLVEMGTRNGAPPSDKYGQFRFATGDLKTRGRYVSLVIDCAPYCFVDEVEVYLGPDELMTAELTGPVVANPKQHFTEMRLRSAYVWRMRADLAAAREAINGSDLPADEKAKLLQEADEIAAATPAIVQDLPADFTTILPLNPVHARTYALNAPVLRSRGVPRFSVWQRNRWDMLAPTDAPDALEIARAPGLSVEMMRGEHRAETFNLTNASDSDFDLNFSIEGLPGGSNPDYISVREVLFTDTRDRRPIAAALPEAARTESGYKVTVNAGCSKQVWLSFNPRDVEPGEYTGTVKLSAMVDSGMRRGEKFHERVDAELPLSLEVAPIDFPNEVDIAIGGWDYTDGMGAYDVTPGNMPMFIANLREHFVNTPWATAGVMPSKAEFDAEGRLTSELDFTAFDAWVERWPDARYYCVFMSVGGSFHGEKMGTDRFNRMVGDYFQVWTSHIADLDIDPGKLAVLLVDEPHQASQVETIIAWAKAIQAATPEVIIWEDPTYKDPREADIEMFETMDVMCPNLPIFMSGSEEARQFYVDQQAAGRELWFYSCSGPARLLDPYSYFRGQFWWAVEYDAKGSHYWAFGDEAQSGNSWNAYLATRNQYSPLFITPTSITDGKQMEAIREGAQDFQYFVMLRARVEELEAAGRQGPQIEAAKALLETGPRRVIDDIKIGNLGWGEDKDRGVMDRVRLEVLEALTELANVN